MRNKSKLLTSNSAKPIAAIYARYSTANQEESSIDDQLIYCLEWAKKNGYEVPKEFIFTDEKVSGTVRKRKGLGAMLLVGEAQKCQAIICFDSTRLTRSMRDGMEMWDLCQFHGIKLIFAAENLDSDMPGCKLMLQAKMIGAEAYIDNIKLQTKKAHEGRLVEGFIIGSVPFGFRTVELPRISRSGTGKKPIIHEQEAAIVRRIFKEFIAGESLSKIASTLNAEGVDSRIGGGWNTSEVSRIVKNETYRGVYIYRRTSKKRNPKTCDNVIVKHPEDKWFRRDMPEFRLISDETWLAACERAKAVNEVFKKGAKGSSWGKQERGRSELLPNSLLSGSLRCGGCGAAIVQRTGKGGGYFGCRNSSDGRCNEKKLIRRDLLEKVFLRQVDVLLHNPHAIEKIIKTIEAKISERFSNLPTEMKSAQKRLSDCRRALQNLKDAIKETGYKKILMDEIDAEALKEIKIMDEVKRIQGALGAVPICPSMEWIKDQLRDLRSLLNRRIGASALAVRKLFGEIIVKYKPDCTGKDEWEVTTRFGVFTLLSFFSSDGSTPLQNWRWRESNPRPRSVNSSFLHV